MSCDAICPAGREGIYIISHANAVSVYRSALSALYRAEGISRKKSGPNQPFSPDFFIILQSRDRGTQQLIEPSDRRNVQPLVDRVNIAHVRPD